MQNSASITDNEFRYETYINLVSISHVSPKRLKEIINRGLRHENFYIRDIIYVISLYYCG